MALMGQEQMLQSQRQLMRYESGHIRLNVQYIAFPAQIYNAPGKSWCNHSNIFSDCIEMQWQNLILYSCGALTDLL